MRAALGVVTTAVAGALAAAVITPETLASWLPDGTPELDYKRVENETGSLAFEVPTTWAASDTDYLLDGIRLGPGLTSGDDPSLPANTVQARAFLGASTATTYEVLGGARGDDTEAALTDLVRSFDWTLEECVFDRESTMERSDGVSGVYRVWKQCGQSTQVLYDGFFAPPDGAYVASVQVQLTEDYPAEMADHIFQSFRVLPERLAE